MRAPFAVTSGIASALALSVSMGLACNTATLTDASSAAASACGNASASCDPLPADAPAASGCRKDELDPDPYARLVPGAAAYPIGCKVTIEDAQGSVDGLCHPIAACECANAANGPRWLCTP
jgi:hypothetical protein